MSNSLKTPWQRKGALLAAIALSTLAACSSHDATELIASGRNHLEKKDYRAAVIEFKNALQRDPASDEARFLLGVALMDSGDSSGALVEFNKLNTSGFDPDRLQPRLAEVMLVHGELDKVIAEFAGKKLGTPKAQAALAATLASAYGIRGKFDLALASAEASLKDDPEGLNGRLVMAQIKTLRDDPAGAMADVENAERTHPKSARPKIFKAELMGMMQGRFDASAIAQTYREGLALDPKSIQAHAGLIHLALTQKDEAAAKAQLDQLRKVYPSGAPTQYFIALLALERRELPAAVEAIQLMLKFAPDNVAGLQLAGRIAFEAGNYAQAAAHLGKALPRTTQTTQVRLLLARSLLRAGDNKMALSTLQPLINERSGVPAEAFTLAADAQVRLGEPEVAKQLYQRALTVNPQNERARSALAVVDISEGRIDQGVRVLKEVGRTSNDLQADILVASTYIESRQFERARAAIDDLEKKRPDSAAGPYLRGELALAQGDVSEATRQYEAASKKDSKDFSAVAALAALDQRAGKPEAAVARYKSYLEKNPRSLNADLAVISLAKAQGQPPSKIAADLETLVKKYPDSEFPRVALVRALLEGGDVKRAQVVGKEVQTAFPASPAALDAAGLVELVAGNHNQARQTFSQLAALQPKDAGPLLRLSQVHLANKDATGALAQLTKALTLQPGNVEVHFQMVSLLAKMGRYDRALAQARTAQTAVPASPAGWMLEGDLLNGKRDFVGAVAAYRKGLAKARVGASAVKLHRALEDAARLKEAQQFEKEWRTERPQDPVFNYYLGDRYLALGELDTSAELYRTVLKVVPKDPASLNNLAWILSQQGKPEALETAERALSAAPKSAPAFDTLAEIHSRAGRLDKAVAAQRQAADLAPNQPMMRLRLAQYLLKDKQLPAARKELEVLAGLGAKFPKQDEVKRLMGQL
ncbi:XrtA/PEP-CTERM system TPR-repeat protein PrsT [Roseateles asaccharophilus]|uniref:PEP-CTERM system TPR-repeat lipoprotein n=1 Tax=Roseateles asaccharophilus TaxID=582607 RepID=A0ABU2AAI3_9BURK|nr:XrtA/PEP-CTERM system TPR-repeat protein PrsT [Roseateles asaccharophilus]MDR7334196.1 putative PEP-CTERM system TPR-repeat lipoprotein [Roseateles asaccharophilus]